MIRTVVEKMRRGCTATFALTALALASASSAIYADTPIKGCYVGTEFYAPTVTWQNNARNSGFTHLFLFTLSVDAAGTITGFGQTLCQNGTYVGDSTWGAKLAACKTAPSSVTRIELCIGSWGSTAFANIKSLVSSQGTGTTSILYKNFLALKNATGVDAIQFDDETTYDATSMVAFANMLSGMGLKIALVPYTQQAFWVNVKSQLGTKVDAIYLQCYDGGASNDPISWNTAFGGFKVTPGLWGNTDTKMSVMTKMRSWNASALGLPGGFMWLNGSMPGDAASWAEALKLGLEMPFYIVRNRQTGLVLDLSNGNTADGAAVQAYHYDYNDTAARWAMVPTENADHFKLISYLSASCIDIVGGVTTNGALIEDRQYYTGHTDQQWDLVEAGNGYYKIQNVKSAKVLESVGTADFSSVYQTTDTGATSQQWELIPHGQYFLRGQKSGKYVSIQSGSTANGSHIVQYDQQDNPWYKWKFTNEVDGWYAAFSTNASTKVICVNGGSTVAGAYLYLYDYNPANTGDQRVRIRLNLDGTCKFYFQHDGMSWDIGGGSTANNAAVNQYPDTANLWQRFKMERVHE